MAGHEHNRISNMMESRVFTLLVTSSRLDYGVCKQPNSIYRPAGAFAIYTIIKPLFFILS